MKTIEEINLELIFLKLIRTDANNKLGRSIREARELIKKRLAEIKGDA